ncbi:MAG: amino acid adenylation domain-containing protein [Candidatus Thiodiazotropha sp.]
MNRSGNDLGIDWGCDTGTEFITEPDLPLSSIQMGILAEQWVDQKTTRYNVPVAFSLRGIVDVEALRGALARLVARHEILRTVYLDSDKGPIQAIAPELPDLLRRYPVDDEAELVVAAHAEAAHIFDLSTEPPLRMALLEASTTLSALVLVFHHIAVDGWSIRLLLDELTRFYNSSIAGEIDELPEVALQYADWSAWQQERLAKADAEWACSLEAKRLATLPLDLGLPQRAARPGEPDAEMLTFLLNQDLVARIEERASSEGVTPYALLAGAYLLVIAGLTDHKHLALGTPVALREHGELHGTVGCFINTLTLTLELDPCLSKSAYLRQVRDAVLSALDGREVPFERVMRQLAQRRGGEAQVVRTFFNFDDACIKPPAFTRLEVSPITCDYGTAKFDLMLSLVRVAEGIRAGFDYAVGVLEPEIAHRVPERFRAAVSWLCHEAALPLGCFNIVDSSEAATLLALGRGETYRPPALTLDEAVLRMAAKAPTQMALEAPDGELNFSALGEAAEALADQLANVGIGRGDRVLILLPRSTALPVAMLGVMRAAAAYVPLETHLPAVRLGKIIEDARPAAILCTSAQRQWVAEVLSGTGAEPALFEASTTDFRLIGGGGAPQMRSRATPNDLAYMIYTSGSTGLPKGVMVPHRGVMNYLSWALESYQVAKGKGAPALTATAFDATLLPFWAPLLAGRPLHLLPEEGALEVLAERLTHSGGYGFIKLTPVHLDLLAELCPVADQRVESGLLVVGGEALSVASARVWRQAAPALRIINEYGPTETVVGCAAYEVVDLSAEDTGVPIGRAIWNTRLYVLNRRLDLLPTGMPGELYVGGAGVAWGYWNQPALTAQRFLADPFSEHPGAVMYRTGDRVRFRDDGNLEYLGRVDDQVKIRGYRIELAEVEVALRTLDGVRQAAVVAKGEGNERRLVAFLVGDLAPKACRAALAQVLPPYLIPDLILAQDELPLTSNGKLDRAKLAALPVKMEQTTREQERPHNVAIGVDPLRLEALVSLWRIVLKQEEVNAYTDLFASGATSLDAIRLIARLKRSYGVTLSFAELTATATPAALAARLFGKESEPETLATVLKILRAVLDYPALAPNEAFFAAGGTSLHAVRAVVRLKRALNRELPANLVHTGGSAQGIAAWLAAEDSSISVDRGPARQLGEGESPIASPCEVQFWLEQKMGGGGSAYVIQTAIRLILDNPKVNLASAFETLADRHPLLRTRYLDAIGAPEIGIDAVGSINIELHYPADGESLEAKVAAIAQYDASQPFDLELGESCRISFIQQGDKEGVLVLSLHHIIADGTTLSLVLHDLLTLLAGEDPGPQPSADYRAYAAWRNKRVCTIEAAQRSYWQEHLRDVPEPLEIPLDWPRSRDHRPQGGSLEFTIDRGSVVAAERFAHTHGATLQALFAGVYALFLHRLTGASDWVIGIPVSERPEGFDKVVGLFLNTLPLRLKLTSGDNGETLVARCAEAMAGLLSHADLPLAQIVEAVNPTRIAGHTPLFQTVFDWREAHISSAEIPAAQRLGAEAFPLEVASAPFELALSLARGEAGEVVGGFIYDRGLLAPETVAVWTRSFLTLLHGIVQEGSTPLVELAAVAEEDLSRALLRGPTCEVAPALGDLMWQAFTEHATQAALEGPGSTLTYAELMVRVAAFEPTPEPIAIIDTSDPLERVIEALAAVLNGQVFALIDPALPAARQERMLAKLAKLEQLPGHQNAAYTQFTSGSSGEPKGVLLSRPGLANLIRVIGHDLELGPGSRVLQLAAPAFDAWIWEVFSSLGAGATLLLAERDTLAAGPSLAATLRERQVSHLTITPSALAALGTVELPDLTCLVTAGESLSADLMDKWAPGRRMFNAYGPCEATICTSLGLCKPGARPVDIGTPIAGMAVMVADRYGMPAIPGAPGELQVGGVGVGLGYLSTVADDRFIQHRLLGGAAYRSGDRVRVTCDGRLQFLGRDDRQVKVRGVRIELDEVEAILLTLPGIEQAAALCVADALGESALAVWVTGPPEDSAGAVRDALATYLPESMLPAYLSVLATMPTTATGKIDRNALAAPQNSIIHQARATAEREPVSEQEGWILDLYREVLSLAERPGREDNFFTLGGHSLLAVRLAGLLTERYGRQVPLPLLFANPTAAELSQLLTEDWVPRPCILRTLREGAGAPAFLFHPVDGSGRCYHSLAQKWVDGRRIVAVEQGEGFASLDSMAKSYAKAIATEAGKQPILLAGWSLGALIAVAVTARLRRRGLRVGLVLIDAAHPALVKQEDQSVALERAAAEAGADAETIGRVRDNIRMGIEHRFTAIPGGAGLLRAAERSDTSPLPEDLGWRRVFTALHVSTVPGSHHSLLRTGDLTALSHRIESVWKGEINSE